MAAGAAGTSGPTGDAAARSAEKDPEDWVTGGEPATGAQESYLGTLAREAGEEAPEGLTKAEASEQIDRLQQETGRGAS
ncbi:DUF3072 family protein [Motilibacter rhizosphaerae]|uniref:DUF3072 family protein n=1 Tax=Motilibacter rhizosphaerae TaxID=598652 RepID=A0A4Q7NGP9_9ACTN|nr:DUF3072 domain-containing protein [Motilibacter rhizosphaerae]RZS82999.1 DUF3072 family protein [Motilibacter rhizosphaerae]